MFPVASLYSVACGTFLSSHQDFSFFSEVNPAIFSERKPLLLVLTFFHLSIHLFFLHISYTNHLLKLVLNS